MDDAPVTAVGRGGHVRLAAGSSFPLRSGSGRLPSILVADARGRAVETKETLDSPIANLARVLLRGCSLDLRLIHSQVSSQGPSLSYTDAHASLAA